MKARISKEQGTAEFETGRKYTIKFLVRLKYTKTKLIKTAIPRAEYFNSLTASSVVHVM